MVNRQIGIHGIEERQVNDLYCTNPIALDLLLDEESFDKKIWECANGLSHLSDRLIKYGYEVRKSDIIKYSEDTEIIDFLEYNGNWKGDIITNPPYSLAQEFVEKALQVIDEGHKVAMYLKINFLSSQKRKKFFEEKQPKTIYIMTKRYGCAKNGDFIIYDNGTVDYCWIVWEKGHNGITKVKWI